MIYDDINESYDVYLKNIIEYQKRLVTQWKSNTIDLISALNKNSMIDISDQVKVIIQYEKDNILPAYDFIMKTNADNFIDRAELCSQLIYRMINIGFKRVIKSLNLISGNIDSKYFAIYSDIIVNIYQPYITNTIALANFLRNKSKDILVKSKKCLSDIANNNGGVVSENENHAIILSRQNVRALHETANDINFSDFILDKISGAIDLIKQREILPNIWKGISGAVSNLFNIVFKGDFNTALDRINANLFALINEIDKLKVDCSLKAISNFLMSPPVVICAASLLTIYVVYRSIILWLKSLYQAIISIF